VVLYHAYLRSGTGLPRTLAWLIAPFGYGRIAVDIFIVLSGYCLMLPVARSADRQLRGGVWEYLKRRARRILPPYYIAYLLSLGLVLLSELPRYLLHRPNELQAAISPGNILSHLLLLFNWTTPYRFSINGAFWSVATEWQIYFLFPLVLLPVWRRFGTLAAVLAGLAVGMASHYLLQPPGQDGASLYYVGLFGLGMAGAIISFSTSELRPPTPDRRPWGSFALALSIPFAIITARVRPLDPWSPALMRHYTPWSDVWVGLIAMCLLISCARCKQGPSTGGHTLLLRLLESPAVVKLGAFSYSVYLTHLAILDKVNQVALHFRLSPLLSFVWQWLVGTSVALAVAYLFYLAVERRFLNARQSAT